MVVKECCQNCRWLEGKEGHVKKSGKPCEYFKRNFEKILDYQTIFNFKGENENVYT